MAFSTPRTWSTGEIVTAALMNVHVRDNFNGVFDSAHSFTALQTFDAKLALNFADGSGDPSIEFKQGGTATYVMGIDDAVSSGTADLFKIHSGTSLIDASDLVLSKAGVLTLNTGGLSVNNSGGISINMGSGTGTIQEFRNSGFTGDFSNVAATDIFGRFNIRHSGGGFVVEGFNDGWGGALDFRGHSDATDADNTDTTGSDAVNYMAAYEDNGSNSRQAVASGNIFIVRNASVARLLVKEDGELHLGNTTTVALDDWDDVHLLRAYTNDTADPASVIRSKYDDWVRYNHDDLVEAGIIGRVTEDMPEGTEGLWNISQHIKLLNGAVWQGYTRQMEIEERLAVTEKKLMALEESNA